MKKTALLAAALFATMALCSCDTRPLHRQYAEDIKKQLEVSEEDDWAYTYLEAEPKKKSAYIIEFYINGFTSSHSTWYCIKEGSKIDCDMIRITYY